MKFVSRDPMALIVRRNVGRFIRIAGGPEEIKRAIAILIRNGIPASMIRIGTKGEADLQGIKGGQECPRCDWPIHPFPFAIEVKNDTDGEQTPEQFSWQKNVWERRGGLYVIARSNDDVRMI